MASAEDNPRRSSAIEELSIDAASDIGQQDNDDHSIVLQSRGENYKRVTTSQEPAQTKPIKKLSLFRGNFVLDAPVPSRLLDQTSHSLRDEFTHMRYTAVTCDPAEFYHEQYSLRPLIFARRRHTEIMISVTMCNENDILFGRTMSGILNNIDHLQRQNETVWGKDSWKKIVVCIISDGRREINARTRSLLAGMGVYQDGIAKQSINGESVTAHLYEYTTQLGLKIEDEVVNLTSNARIPCQIIFCLKERHQGKVNSHRWAFQAFGQVLLPSVCILLDSATRLTDNSIYELWKALDRDPKCGCAYGRTRVVDQSILNPIIARQYFEYSMQSMLERPFESVLGYTFNTSGAFYGYRFVALQDDKRGEGPLDQYFAGELAGRSPWASNVHSAEEKNLNFALVTKRRCCWKLTYVSTSRMETDVPKTMSEYLLQRRRWHNGNFFSSLYAVTKMFRIFQSRHNILRKLMILFQSLYMIFKILFDWFSIGNLFLVFHILTRALGNSYLLGNNGYIIAVVFEYIYILLLFIGFFLALSHSLRLCKDWYAILNISWMGIMIFIIYTLIYIIVKSVRSDMEESGSTISTLVKTPLFVAIVLSLLAITTVWLAISLISLNLRNVIAVLPYILFIPTSINVVKIYSFCNIPNVSWESRAKPQTSAISKSGAENRSTVPAYSVDRLNIEYDLQIETFSRRAKQVPDPIDDEIKDFRGFRTLVVFWWIFCNSLLVTIVLSVPGLGTLEVGPAAPATQSSIIYLGVIFWSMAATTVIECAGALLFHLLRVVSWLF